MSRLEHIARLRVRLERAHWPRFQMLLIVALTGGIGFLASYLLRDAGMVAMWQRYPAAVGIAYVAFLILLWLWAITFQTRAHEYLDIPSGGGSGGGSDGHAGGGGHSGGGGASASFQESAPSLPAPMPELAMPKIELPDGADGCAGDDGLGWLLLLAIAALLALAGLALLSLWVVWIAPTLMAELLLDVALAGSLYRRLRRIQTQHWVRTVLRHTFWPMLAIALVLAGLGYAGARYAPGADSIGDVVAAYQARD